MQKAFLLLGAAILIAVLIFGTMQYESGETGGDAGGSESQSSSSSAAASVVRSTAIGRELACADGVDNERDRLTDCDDPDCAGSQECRCSVRSCGNAGTPGSSLTCLREEGCICDSKQGCIACRVSNQTCVTSGDCCFGLGLGCTEVFLGSGVRERRCMPVQRQICTIRCKGNAATDEQGTWGNPTNCAPADSPPDLEDCPSLQGTCNLSPNADRNQRKCWKS